MTGIGFATRALAATAVAIQLFVAAPAHAQGGSPIAAALRDQLRDSQKNLVGAAERMPADKYSYKPTPKHFSFAEHVLWMADFSADACSQIGGAKAPAGARLKPSATKEELVKHLRASFAFCTEALAKLDDAHFGEPAKLEGKPVTKAALMLNIVGDWNDHYAVMATYLRLNNLLPPTAG